MAKLRNLYVIIFSLLMSIVSCISLTGNKDELGDPPELSSDTPVLELLDAGIDFGEETLEEVKKIIRTSSREVVASDFLYEKISKHHDEWSASRLINAVHLFQAFSRNDSAKLFMLLAKSKKNICQQLAWHIAASHPSKEMATVVENKLTLALANNEVSALFWPKMADAVANNNLVESYTLVRQGLFESNHVAFVKAMAALKPRKASDDFMDYLARAPVEELRQLNLTTIDIFSCLEILEHMKSYPVEISHPRFENLFFFAISRNTALSELSRKILQSYLPSKSNHLAFILARMPDWIQIAFVEGTRRTMSPQLSHFLKDLQRTTNQRDVIEEISNVVR